MAKFLNNNIKYLRTQKNLSQQDLAKKAGIDRSTISRIENGIIETTLDNAIKISDALEVSLYELIGRDLKSDDTLPKKNNDHYKQLLKEKGIMDENEVIDEKTLDKLIKIADMIQDIEKK